MCVVALAIGVSPDFPFALVHNRDEYYSRPSTPLHLSKNNIAGGTDNQAGGMWLGARKDRFCFVTNFRRGLPIKGQQYRSRGELVKNFLESDVTPDEYLENLPLHEYSPFNLVLGNTTAFTAFSSDASTRLDFANGVHGFSNGELGKDWPKTARLKRGLNGMLRAGLEEDRLVASLLDLLSDSQLAEPKDLPQTGIPPERELALSSIFIRGEEYGTVSSTVILQEKSGTLKIWERTFDRKGRPTLRNLNI